MAKVKKKASLSLEEMLEQALVSTEEQPYEVPENWCWATISSVSELYTGNSINEKVKKEKYMNQPEGLSFIATKDVEFDNSIVYDNGVKINDYEKFKVAPANTSLLCIEGGSAGRKVGFTREKVCFGNKLCAFVDKVCVPKYVYYYLQSNVFHVQFMNQRHGLIGGVSVKELSNISIPVATLAEQQRIVVQIENLFVKLDEAKERLEDAIGGIELRKASILHKAFGGQLTTEWRNMNGIELSSWEHKLFRNILDVRDGTHDSPQYYDEGYPLITSKNLKNGIITDKDIKYISKEDYEQINLRSKVDVGDVLFAMIGTIGNPVVVVEEPNYAIKNMALFKNIGQINPFFLKYYLDSKTVKDKMQKEAKGSTQKFVALGYLRDFPISVPSVDEQAEIVRILDVMLGKENDVEFMLQNTMEQIELMKKSILAKAFRGELGTNNPEEESATELLKSILLQE